MKILTVNLDDDSRVQTASHTSKGDQPKWQIKDQWVKADHMGYETLAEVLISALLRKTNISKFVSYRPVWIQYQDRVLRGCASDNFRKKSEELIPVERLHRLYHGYGLAEALGKLPSVEDRIQYAVDFIERETKLTNVGPYLTTMLELDQLFLNEDRHTNNIAVIRDNKTGGFRLCPIFDNGLALLSDINDYPLGHDIYASIDRVKAKPFSTDFDSQADAANQLYGSFLRCSFTKHDVTAILNSLEPLYPQQMLRRVEQIMFEQMRKYPIYF